MTRELAHIVGLGWVGACGLGRGPAGFALSPGAWPALRRSELYAWPDLRFGRLDDFSKAGLGAIALALQDAGWIATDAPPEKKQRNVGLIAATDVGALATDLTFLETLRRPAGASPYLFTYTLPSVFLGEAALRFHLTGPTFTAHGPDAADNAGALFTALRLALETLSDLAPDFQDEDNGQAADHKAANGSAAQIEAMLAGVCNAGGSSLYDAARPPLALFFLLVPRPAPRAQPATSYATLGLTPDGALLCDQAPVTDLLTFLHRLARPRP